MVPPPTVSTAFEIKLAGENFKHRMRGETELVLHSEVIEPAQ